MILQRIAVRMIITIGTSVVLILSAYINTVSAMNWEDKEWVEAGCPIAIRGTWSSGSPNEKIKKSLNIQTDKISITHAQNNKELFSFSGKTLKKRGRYAEMALQSRNIEINKDTYFKIRPLMAPESRKSGAYTCFIKVFQFNSEKNMKFDKYSSWDIYQLKN